ncbi:MAG: VWA domain-containing protein [Treponema sp.]|nr:VWA domain-containing protein [Treponema sp.]
MNLAVERPWALCAILVLIPVLIYCVSAYKKTFFALSNSYEKKSLIDFKKIKIRIVARIAFRCAAWCALVLAYSGISWGTISTPVQKNGSAISFVFDISYSMTARDMPGNFSRLEASQSYARKILERVEGSSVSAVLAKGSGVLAIPLTEDLNAVLNLLESLSPEMISSVGSDLGEGVNAALKSFPRNISKKPVIWLFTDGEETSPSLSDALSASLRHGVSVVIVGFGSERETEILSGDGKTHVKTAMRSEKIRKAVEEANKKNFGEQGFSFFQGASAKFVDASKPGSAAVLLSSAGDFFAKSNFDAVDSKENFSLDYDIRPNSRYTFFILIALVFFCLSLFVSEFSLISFKEALAVSVLVFPFFSCSAKFDESKKILEATWAWHQKDYDEAVAKFSQSLSDAQKNGDDLISQYALYGISATYLAQNENAAALEKINSLSSESPKQIQFAAFYNAGIIAHRNGEYEKAEELFKNALLVDGRNLNAKINLELSQRRTSDRAQGVEQLFAGAQEADASDSILEDSVFNMIRENEKNQWKNLQSEQKKSQGLDY